MEKFLWGDVLIYFERPKKFIDKGLVNKKHKKNMLVHYGNSQKDFYIDHFTKQYENKASGHTLL